jgi:quinol monooxygenase YgiN
MCALTDTVKAMNSQLDVVAHIQAAPGNEELVREVLEGYVVPTRLEEGCLRYDLFIDIDNASKFTFIEAWTSSDALYNHSQSAHILAGRARLEGKLAVQAWVQKLTQIA